MTHCKSNYTYFIILLCVCPRFREQFYHWQTIRFSPQFFWSTPHWNTCCHHSLFHQLRCNPRLGLDPLLSDEILRIRSMCSPRRCYKGFCTFRTYECRLAAWNNSYIYGYLSPNFARWRQRTNSAPEYDR